MLKARKKALDAHLVVANHALVLSEAAAGAGNILPAYARLVIDEAHNLEDSATDFLSRTLSQEGISRILRRLSRKGRGKTGTAGGTLAAIDRQLRKGILESAAAAGRIRSLLNAANPAAMRLQDETAALLDVAAKMLRRAGNSSALRFRKPEDGARGYFVRGLLRDFAPDEWDEKELAAALARFENETAGMVKILHEMRDAIESSVPPGEFNYLADLATQLEGIAENLVEASNEAVFALAGKNEDFAYWVERREVALRGGRRRTSVRVVAAPLCVADALDKLVYSQKDSVVLASATLRVGNDFGYMSRRLGCRERFRAMTAASPFDYLTQCAVFALDCLPDPSAPDGRYAAALAPLLKDVFAATGARALALFTSYEMMNAVAALAHGPLAEAGMKLLVQGEGLSREAMARALKTEPGTVLFGSQSFWEGVDVAGEALSCVAIARLPFANAGDPVVEARAEKIEREGGSSFRDYSLPEAVIKFRQGFGRLVRTRRDKGVVVVADPRLVTKNYGSTFRRSIPASVHTVSSAEELLRRIEEFMEQ